MLELRFFVAGECLPKGSMSGFPIDRGACDECAKTRGDCLVDLEQAIRSGDMIKVQRIARLLEKTKTCAKRNCFGGRSVGVTVTDQGGPELDRWQQLVHITAVSARNKAGQKLVEAPAAVEVSLVFVMERPAGHWTDRGQLTAAGRARPHPTVKPDADKMERVIADALTGSLVGDDAILCFGKKAKVYAPYRGKTGVIVRARQVTTLDAWIENELQYAGLSVPRNQVELL